MTVTDMLLIATTVAIGLCLSTDAAFAQDAAAKRDVSPLSLRLASDWGGSDARLAHYSGRYAVQDQAGDAEAPDSKPAGILPIPEYGGDFWERKYLLGDWNGSRTDLANLGIQVNAEYYQFFQNVADGGSKSGPNWGGKANVTVHLDLAKMGVTSGLIYARVDSRWGDSTIGDTGQLLPANEAFLVPVDFNDLERETWGTLTALNYTQFVSPKFAVFGGRLDNMDGDPNEFAGGRGDTQFMNYSLMYAAPTAIVPASTVGVGVLFMPNEHVTIASQFTSATDSSFKSFGGAFDDWDDGQIWTTALMTQYRIGDLPGGFNAMFLQWFNSEFTEIGSIAGALSSTEDKSWLVALSAWQYLYTEESSEGPLDATNKIPDLQGLGLFARLGFADEDTNPFKTTFSVGLGGRGPIEGRDNDLFGLGYFYTATDSDNLLDTVGIEQSAQGVEAFYSLAVTPWTTVSLDIQWLDASVPDTDDAVPLGARVRVRF
jgi:porin